MFSAIPGDKPCGGTYNIKPNSILHFDSTNYPNGYTNDQSCTWQFMSGPGTIVEAFLLRADVEAGFDWLNVGSGSDPSNQTSVIEKISGAVLARPFASDDNMMWISFYSDYSNSGDGFSFLIEGIDPSEFATPHRSNLNSAPPPPHPRTPTPYPRLTRLSLIPTYSNKTPKPFSHYSIPRGCPPGYNSRGPFHRASNLFTELGKVPSTR